MLIEHRKKTRSEGAQHLAAVGTTIGVLGTLMMALLVLGHASWPFGAAGFLILTLIGVIGGIYATLNILANREFICRLNDKTLECISPVWGCGETFKLSLTEIIKIEKECWSDSHRWYLVDKAGERYWLTTNYDNPADEFLARIRELCPSVEDVNTGSGTAQANTTPPA